MSESYTDLLVWKKSMDLVVEIYHLVKQLPKEETYALSDQMRRAAVSIPSNIAEGKTETQIRPLNSFCQSPGVPLRNLKHNCCYVIESVI